MYILWASLIIPLEQALEVEFQGQSVRSALHPERFCQIAVRKDSTNVNSYGPCGTTLVSLLPSDDTTHRLNLQ